MAPTKVLVPLLIPIVSLCLRRGIKVQEFLEAAKRAFVEAAKQELQSSAQKENVSRIALMTGLQRGDVNRIRNLPVSPPYAIDLTTRIIGQWCNHKSFSSRGVPRELSIKRGPLSFAQLVASVSKDINPSTVLFELERIEAVVRKKDSIELVTRGYSPADDQENEALGLLAADVYDLTRGVEDNITRSKEIPNLHISTRYDNIVPQALPQIRAWLLKKGTQFQSEVRAFLSRFDKDLNPTLFASKGGARVSLGTFSFSEEPVTGKGEQNVIE